MYASSDRMAALFGVAELRGLVPDGVDFDRALVDAALVDASNEIDSYLATRYPSPLAEVPAAVDRAACDIARYFLYKDRPTEQVAQRYKEVTAWLANVARGVVTLVFAEPLDPDPAAILQQRPLAGVNVGGIFSDVRLATMPEVHAFPYPFRPARWP